MRMLLAATARSPSIPVTRPTDRDGGRAVVPAASAAGPDSRALVVAWAGSGAGPPAGVKSSLPPNPLIPMVNRCTETGGGDLADPAAGDERGEPPPCGDDIPADRWAGPLPEVTSPPPGRPQRARSRCQLG